MGQAASKASNAAGKASKTILTPDRISRATGAAVGQSGASIRGAEAPYAPTRGAGHNVTGGDGGATGPPEMPPELIKFLNDAGPLKRSIDKELTSPKVYDSLVKENHEGNDSIKSIKPDNENVERRGAVNEGDEVNTAVRDQQNKEANVRVRRRMRIVGEDHNAGAATVMNTENNDTDDGTTVMRTTNFSTTDRTGLYTGFGLTREDLFRLASSPTIKSSNATSLSEEGDADVQLDKMKQMIQPILMGDGQQSTRNQIASDQLELLRNMTENDATLLRNALQYISIPSLMKDTDGDILGTSLQKAKESRFSAELKMVKEGGLKFVIEEENGFGF